MIITIEVKSATQPQDGAVLHSFQGTYEEYMPLDREV
jgi:hypothetical protein